MVSSLSSIIINLSWLFENILTLRALLLPALRKRTGVTFFLRSQFATATPSIHFRKLIFLLVDNILHLQLSATCLTTSITVPSTHLMAATILSVKRGLSGFPQMASASSFNS